MTDGDSGTLALIDPESIRKNPHNPRRYFNEEHLDLLRTSIQEVGILVPLIVYQSAPDDEYVLMDGERRWNCSIDLGLTQVPANIIDSPSDLDNLLRMFNIHNVREDWPLISVALSLREVAQLSGENGEKRLSELTGLTRSTVRRAKRLLSIPQSELDLIAAEAHLDRSRQVHREDLYLEIQSAESVMRNSFPAIAEQFTAEQIYRAFAAKAEDGVLNAVTDFRYVGRLAKAAQEGLVDSQVAEAALSSLVTDSTVSPKALFDEVAAGAYRQHTLQRKAELLVDDLRAIRGDPDAGVSDPLRAELESLRDVITLILAEADGEN